MYDFMKKIHYAIVGYMAKLWIVENILIAKAEHDGELIDCIYCTILRNMVLFLCIGFIIGFISAKFL